MGFQAPGGKLALIGLCPVFGEVTPIRGTAHDGITPGVGLQGQYGGCKQVPDHRIPFQIHVAAIAPAHVEPQGVLSECQNPLAGDQPLPQRVLLRLIEPGQRPVHRLPAAQQLQLPARHVGVVADALAAGQRRQHNQDHDLGTARPWTAPSALSKFRQETRQGLQSAINSEHSGINPRFLQSSPCNCSPASSQRCSSLATSS